MSDDITEFLLWDYTIFLDKIFIFLRESAIDVSELHLDHICYRVSSLERYDELKMKLWEFWVLLSENLISGRNISTFKLSSPLIYKEREIYVLELPQPKQGSHYDEWFEHVEFVIDSSFDEFMEKYSHVKFITKDILKENNPDIKIKNQEYSVKFHLNSLEDVIKKELDFI